MGKIRDEIQINWTRLEPNFQKLLSNLAFAAAAAACILCVLIPFFSTKITFAIDVIIYVYISHTKHRLINGKLLSQMSTKAKAKSKAKKKHQRIGSEKQKTWKRNRWILKECRSHFTLIHHVFFFWNKKKKIFFLLSLCRSAQTHSWNISRFNN